MKNSLLTIVLLIITLYNFAQTPVQTTFINNLNNPVALAIAPDGRFFITLKGGDGFSTNQDGKVVVYNSDGTFQNLLWDFTDSVETFFERGVLGVTLDDNFSTNHFVYVFYNHSTPSLIRVVRFTENNGIGSNPTIIFEVNDVNNAGNHTGGNIHFNPADPGKLYITIGDRADVPQKAQDTSTWEGKILRINKDGSIPTDNPFYDDGNVTTGFDDRIFALGLRNTFDFCFLPNGKLYGSENGQNTSDEINYIQASKNYGWPDCEGTTDFFSSCNNVNFTAPATFWMSTPSVTGIIYYNSSVFPQFTNHLLVTDFNGYIWDCELNNAQDSIITKNQLSNPGQNNGLTDIAIGNEGCLYYIEGGYNPSGTVLRLCPNNLTVEELNYPTITYSYNKQTEEIVVKGITSTNFIIDLYDSSGKKVKTYYNSSKISTTSLQKGIYTLTLKENTVIPLKVIVY